MKHPFIHTTVLRLFGPPVLGLLVYILILLIFDRIGQLDEHFDTFELLFCIGLTYAWFESIRLAVNLSEKHLGSMHQMLLHMGIQILIAMGASLIVVTSISVGYFRYVHELNAFSSFSSEVYAFNIVFLLCSVFYFMVFKSFILLREQQAFAFSQEDVLKEQMAVRLKAFKQEIKPELMYTGLETILSYLSHDNDKAEKILEEMSEVYRYSLGRKKEELAAITEETEAVTHLLAVINPSHAHNIHFEADIPDTSFSLIPGTLTSVVEYVVRQSIISDSQALYIKCFLEDEYYLVIQARLNARLQTAHAPAPEIDWLKKTYARYSHREVLCVKGYREILLKIPLLPMEISELADSLL